FLKFVCQILQLWNVIYQKMRNIFLKTETFKVNFSKVNHFDQFVKRPWQKIFLVFFLSLKNDRIHKLI
ncbi:MAG: hypothetical protein IK062_08355, partial [Selenomonadaceae bacterium]|nr:hypothetical protein [Selenomonadaceae bacterium]